MACHHIDAGTAKNALEQLASHIGSAVTKKKLLLSLKVVGHQHIRHPQGKAFFTQHDASDSLGGCSQHS